MSQSYKIFLAWTKGGTGIFSAFLTFFPFFQPLLCAAHRLASTSGYHSCIFCLFSVFNVAFMQNQGSHLFSSEKRTKLCSNREQIQYFHESCLQTPLKGALSVKDSNSSQFIGSQCAPMAYQSRNLTPCHFDTYLGFGDVSIL